MEKENYYAQIADLKETFPGVKQITITEAARYLGVDPRTLKADKSFPVKKLGGRYMVNLINFGRWLA